MRQCQGGISFQEAIWLIIFFHSISNDSPIKSARQPRASGGLYKLLGAATQNWQSGNENGKLADSHPSLRERSQSGEGTGNLAPIRCTGRSTQWGSHVYTADVCVLVCVCVCARVRLCRMSGCLSAWGCVCVWKANYTSRLEDEARIAVLYNEWLNQRL